MSTNAHDDGFDFARKMWGNMGFGLPGIVTPTLDAEELERRIKELQSVEGWLKMNLSMLQMTIQGLEVQRSTLLAMQAMGQAGKEGENNPFSNPALWAWPFGTHTNGPTSPETSSPTPPDASTQPATPDSPNTRNKP
jgi:hypothetical protein